MTRLLRTIEKGIRAGVIAADAAMTLHCLLLPEGGTWLFEALTGISALGFVALWACGILMRYCWRYYVCLCHLAAVRACIIIEREIGFGHILDTMSTILFVTGAIAVVLAIRRRVCAPRHT